MNAPIESDRVAATPAKSKRKMRPGGGKSKGNSFEGVVAKTLSKALSPLNFIRTPGSGARVGGKNFETIGKMFGEDALKIFVGDVVPVNARQEGLIFKHSVECKSYATPDNFTSLVSGSANLFKWFAEVEVDAAKIDKNPLLIFKWNRTPIFAAFDSMHKHAPTCTIKPAMTLLTYGEGARALDIYLLDDLLTDKAFWV